MKITSKWLEKQNACPDEKAWFLENFKKETTLKKLIEGLIKAAKNGPEICFGNRRWQDIKI